MKKHIKFRIKADLLFDHILFFKAIQYSAPSVSNILFIH